MPKQNTIAWVVSTTEVYFLTGLDAGKQRSGLLSWSGSEESALPGLQMAAFFLCPHMAERASSGLFLFLFGH